MWAHAVNGGHPGCIEVGNASGWVTEAEFLQIIQQFRTMLILDSHSPSPHLHVVALDLAKRMESPYYHLHLTEVTS